VNIPADVVFIQGPERTVSIVGPERTVAQVRLDGGTLRFDNRVRDAGRLTIAVTAPGVEEFTLNGAQRLSIEGYDHDELEIAIHGSGDVIAAGRARLVELMIAGSGDADLSALESEEAEVNIAGSGDATVSPSRSVEVNIAGSGDVTLTTNPPEIESHILGSGRIMRGSSAPPTPPTPPAPPV
jgi:hypothetical protein